MKTKLIVVGVLASILTFGTNANGLLSNTENQLETNQEDSKTAKFKVYGNCGMCKKRIEGALSDVKGVEKANWDVKSKIITVTFDPHVTSLEAIKEKIAAAGHDTDKNKADDKVYNKLPRCCQYERTK